MFLTFSGNRTITETEVIGGIDAQNVFTRNNKHKLVNRWKKRVETDGDSVSKNNASFIRRVYDKY